MRIKKTIITDLNLATTLTTLRYKLIELDRTNRKRVGFVFEYNQKVEQSITDYWNDEIKLPAQTLFNNQKNLKSRIYSDA